MQKGCCVRGIPFLMETPSVTPDGVPAPSGREPLAQPDTLHLSRKLYHHAKGPIPEEGFPRPGEDVTVGDKKGNLSPQATGGVFPNVKSAHDRDALFAFPTKYVIIYSDIGFCIRFGRDRLRHGAASFSLQRFPAERMWPLSKQSTEKAQRKTANIHRAAAASRGRRSSGSRCC